MRKNHAFLVGAAIAALVAHACTMPTLPKRVEVQGNLNYDIPVSLGAMDMGKMLADMLKEDFGSEDFGIWNVNYPGQQAQAFLLKFSMELMKMDSIDAPLDDIDFDPVEIDRWIDTDLFEETVKIEVEIGLADILAPHEYYTGPWPLVLPGLTFDRVIPILGKQLFPEDTSGILYAMIEEGTLALEMDLETGNSTLANINIDHDIYIKQENDGTYAGLSDGSEPVTGGSLQGREINSKEVLLDRGTITLTSANATLSISQADAQNKYITKNLVVRMKVDRLRNVKFDFSEIAGDLASETQEISLEDLAKYAKEIHFNRYSEDASEGIGIILRFSEVFPGLALSITCNDLLFSGIPKPLEKDKDIVFGNESLLRLGLEEYKGGSKKLRLDVAFQPEGGGNVLTIPELTLGETQYIKGTVEFFQNWTKATVYMEEILKGTEFEDGISGSFPDIDAGDDPIDLPALDDYLEGNFTITGAQAFVYLSGKGLSTITSGAELDLSIGPGQSGILFAGPLSMGSPIDLSPYLDEGGNYIRANLPDGGMELNIDNLINSLFDSDEMVFGYDVILPAELEVTPETFSSAGGEGGALTADIMLLLPLQITAGAGGTTVLLGSLIEDGTDIFGRENAGDETDLPDLKTLALHVSVEFSGTLFSGASLKLFGEGADDPLFPEGIALNGRSLGASVSGTVLDDLINPDSGKARLLIPNPRLVFAEGSGVTIPKNFGVSRIQFEISGSYAIDVGDIF